jgi:adenosine deaminase
MHNKLVEFATKIPKSDLHVHLDGSVRVETIIDLSKNLKLSLPSNTVEGLNKLVFKDQYENLVEYLKGFGYVIPLMQSPENLERISYEFAIDNINEGVCYVETRFAPYFHVNDNQSIEQVLVSVNKGLNRAKNEYNQKPEVKAGKLPEFNYGIIACAMRFFCKGFSKFYDTFLDVHQYTNPNTIFSMASLELAKACVAIRDKHGIPIVAIDIAGPEAGNPPIHHKEAYRFAHTNFMGLTAHAGEAWGPESIYQAIAELYPERIGHGFSLFSQDQILDTTVKDKNLYIKRLVQYIAEREITIEVCLTSNLQTIPALKSIKNHPFAHMLDNKLSTAICTDNRTVSKTNATKEITLALQNFKWTEEKLQDVIMTGFEKSFYFGPYLEKREYLQKVAARYKAVAKEYQDVLQNI